MMSDDHDYHDIDIRSLTDVYDLHCTLPYPENDTVSLKTKATVSLIVLVFDSRTGKFPTQKLTASDIGLDTDSLLKQYKVINPN
jgi:hypothetical protein